MENIESIKNENNEFYLIKHLLQDVFKYCFSVLITNIRDIKNSTTVIVDFYLLYIIKFFRSIYNTAKKSNFISYCFSYIV